MVGLLLLALGVIVAFVYIVYIVVTGSRTSLSARLLPRDVREAARKAASGAQIVDARGEADGCFVLALRGSGGLTEMSAHRHGEITVSIGIRCTDFPQSGSFAFRTPESGTISGSCIPPEVVDHVPKAVEKALQSKRFQAAGADEAPTLWVRYHVANDEPIDVKELDRMHGFAEGNQDSGEAALTAMFRQGSLIIDVSSAEDDRLLWRAAAVADVSLEDELPKRLARIDRAVDAMFAGFPPKGKTG